MVRQACRQNPIERGETAFTIFQKVGMMAVDLRILKFYQQVPESLSKKKHFSVFI
jgi:hypothetical protein